MLWGSKIFKVKDGTTIIGKPRKTTVAKEKPCSVRGCVSRMRLVRFAPLNGGGLAA